MDQDKVNAINQLLEKFHANLERGIEPTKRQAEQLKSASTSNLEKLAKDLGSKQFANLEKGVKDYTKAMYEGKQGMEAMAGTLEAISAVAIIVTSIIPPLRVLTLVFAGLTALIVPAVKKISQQADDLFKAYQDLNKNGMATPGGMTDVYNNMQRFNYGLKDLAQMTAMLKDNSTALANFGGTAAAGVKVFASAANEIQHSNVGRDFQRMGKTPDEINRGIAGFIKSQQSLGIQNTDITRNLTASSADYIKRLDLISKLTGQDQDQIQDKLAQANAEAAFNQVQYELKQKALAGDLAAKKQYAENEKIAATLTGTALKEFQQGLGGDMSVMSKTMMTAPDAVRLIQQGAYTATEYFDALGKGSLETRKVAGELMKLNATDSWLLPAKERSMLESRYADQSAQRQEDRAKAEQENQTEALDPTTKATVDLRINQQKTRDALQDLVNSGVKPTIAALGFLEKAGGAAIRMVTGTGGTGGGPTGDLGAKGGVARTTDELRKMGLIIRSGDVQADGRLLDERLIKLAKMAQSQIKGFQVITSLNDRFHAEKYSTSQHALGRAMDFTLDHRPGEEEGQRIVQQLKSMGAHYVIDEYNHPSAGATGGHFHAQVSAAAGFEGTLSGPSSGYRPNIVMHGDERLTITPRNQATNPGSPFGADTATLMKTRLEKIDRVVELFREKKKNNQNVPMQKLEHFNTLVKTMQNQVDVSTKILQAVR